MVDTQNVVSSGVNSHGNAKDPLLACLPASSGILRNLTLLGLLTGDGELLGDFMLKTLPMWKPTQVFTGGAAATPVAIVGPATGRGTVIRVTSPTDASDVLGNTQVQATDGTANTTVARFLVRTGNLIHVFGKLRWSDPAGAMLYGLCNAATGLLAANGTVSGALTDGVYFYKAPGSNTVTFKVRVAGVDVVSAAVTTGALQGTFHEMGFQIQPGGVTYYWLDGTTGLRVDAGATPASVPAVMLALTAIQGGNARTMDIVQTFAAQEAV